MKFNGRTGLALLALALVHLHLHLPASAATISLLTTSNPQSWKLGEEVVLEARLTNLSGIDGLDLLSTTLILDDAIVPAGAITLGDILPNPLADPDDFLTLAEPRLVDVAFSTLSANPAHHIHSEGTFFTVRLMPKTLGAGQIRFEDASATQFNSQNPDTPLDVAVETSPALNFLIIPEPSASILSAIALMLLATLCRRLA